MVMQAKVKGLRRLGEADIEVKIKGQELEKFSNWHARPAKR